MLVGYCAIRDYYNSSKQLRTLKKGVIKPVKVFQIGFSKCGTVTLATFFSKSGIRTIHHDGGYLALSMYQNYLNHQELLAQQYQHYNFYTDMEHMSNDPPLNIGLLMFKELDQQYPGSKFILNTRDKQAWLKSRSLHPLNEFDSTTLLQINAKILHKTEQEVLAKWSKERDEHHKAVIEYFKDRPNDLIVFDIDNDSPQKLKNFFKDYFVLDVKHYKQRNKSTARDEMRAKMQNNRLNANKKQTILQKLWHRLAKAGKIVYRSSEGYLR